jgi:hypothetical protein
MSTDRVATCVSRVTSTMLGRTFQPSATPFAVDPWRIAILPIPGARPVTIAISSDRASCVALALAMLSIDEDSLDLDMIDDVLRELANMSAGQFKRELALDQALGLPKIGDVTSLRAPGARWNHHLLVSEQICLLVSISPE